MTKKEVTSILNKLPGWTCKTFNSHKKMPTGAKGFPDHVITNKTKKIVCFIETKLGRDKLSEGQEEYKEECEKIAYKNKSFYYFLLTEKNYNEIVEEIVGLG